MNLDDLEQERSPPVGEDPFFAELFSIFYTHKTLWGPANSRFELAFRPQCLPPDDEAAGRRLRLNPTFQTWMAQGWHSGSAHSLVHLLT